MIQNTNGTLPNTEGLLRLSLALSTTFRLNAVLTAEENISRNQVTTAMEQEDIVALTAEECSPRLLELCLMHTRFPYPNGLNTWSTFSSSIPFPVQPKTIEMRKRRGNTGFPRSLPSFRTARRILFCQEKSIWMRRISRSCQKIRRRSTTENITEGFPGTKSVSWLQRTESTSSLQSAGEQSRREQEFLRHSKDTWKTAPCLSMTERTVIRFWLRLSGWPKKCTRQRRRETFQMMTTRWNQ